MSKVEKITDGYSVSLNLSTLLTVAFVVLKLTHMISWSWWWMLAPVWIPVVIALIVLAIVLGVAGIIAALND